MDVLRLAFFADEEGVEDHAQERNREMESRLGTSQSPAVKAVDATISAWVAEECERALGEEFSGEKEQLRGDLARDAKIKELDVRKHFQGCGKDKMRGHMEDAGWREIIQGPPGGDGNVDTSACVGLRSSHLRAIRLGALEKWKIRALDVEKSPLASGCL